MKLSKLSLILISSLIIVGGCSKKTATSENNLDGVDVYKYNTDIANVISLNSGLKESELINNTDMTKIKNIFDSNSNSVNRTSVDITDDLSKFLSDLRTDMLLKYNYKNYRYEFDGEEFVSDGTSTNNNLTDNDREVAIKLYKDIDSLWEEYNNESDITAEMLQKIYDTCERYRKLSTPQKGLISNLTKLGNMVENYEGSVDTNFNLEFWKWNIKKLAGEKVDDYDGPSDSDLGIVQGRLMYGENPDGTPYVPITSDSSVTTPAISKPQYDKNTASYDDYATDLAIPIDYYDCVDDNGSSGTNTVNEEKLLNKVASIDSRMYSENNRIYLKVSKDTSPIQLLNWGHIEYYVPDNSYKDYEIKDYVYWDDGKFKLGFKSLDDKDYQILTGYIKDAIVYFDNIENVIPKFADLHIDVVKDLGNAPISDEMKEIYKERNESDSTEASTASDNDVNESETRAGTFGSH